MPDLESAVAYLKDALKKSYAAPVDKAGAEREGTQRALPPPCEEQMRRIREAWEADRKTQARALYDEMPESQKLDTRQKFESGNVY